MSQLGRVWGGHSRTNWDMGSARVRLQRGSLVEHSVDDGADGEGRGLGELDGTRIEEPLQLQSVHDGENRCGRRGDRGRVLNAFLLAELTEGIGDLAP